MRPAVFYQGMHNKQPLRGTAALLYATAWRHIISLVGPSGSERVGGQELATTISELEEQGFAVERRDPSTSGPFYYPSSGRKDERDDD